MLGVVIFGVVVSGLTSYITTGSQSEQLYATKMENLKNFFKVKDVPFSIRRNVRLFYDNLLRKKSVFDESDILDQLPPQLSKDLVFALYGPVINNTTLFVGLEDEVTAKLCMELRPFHVVAGALILREGHVGRVSACAAENGPRMLVAPALCGQDLPSNSA